MARGNRLSASGVLLGSTPLQSIPLPNGTIHSVDTSAGEDETSALDSETKAIALTLTDPHYIELDGTAATTANFKVPAGFTFWPIDASAVSVSLLPEGGTASSGDSLQLVGEYK